MNTLTRQTHNCAFVANSQAEGLALHAVTPRPIWEYAHNDRGNADYFIDRWGAYWRFCKGMGWLGWDGARWRAGSDDLVRDWASRLPRSIEEDMASFLPGQDFSKIGSRMRELGNVPRIEAMLKIAQSDPRILVVPDQIDAEPGWVTAWNGILDLRAPQFLGPRHDYISLHHLGCNFDSTAECPRFTQFVTEIMSNDREMVAFLQRLFGYTLTGWMTEQRFLLLYGTGANGKSLLLTILSALLGTYSATASDELLIHQNYVSSSRNELAGLPGKRMLLVPEIPRLGRLNENLMKRLTGGDKVRGEAKYQSGFDFTPQCKIWIAGNYLPRIVGTDRGIWRRVVVIPFQSTFEGNNCDPHLQAKLLAELPGILNWALAGLQSWKERGLAIPERVQKTSKWYQEDQDLLGIFISSRLCANIASPVRKSAVYASYIKWATQDGLRQPLSNKQFSRELKERGFDDSGSDYWQGISLVP
jgi:putative DNA primase/helicase